MRTPLVQLLAATLFLATPGLGSTAQAKGRFQRLINRLKPQKKAEKVDPSRRRLLGIDAGKKGLEIVRSELQAARAEAALTPSAIEVASKSPAKAKARRPALERRTTRSISRRKVLGFLAAGLVLAAIPKPARALDFKGTREFFANLFPGAQADEAPKQSPRPAEKPERRDETKDRARMVSPIAAGAGARISSRFSSNRKNPVTKKWQPHRGVDIAANRGTDVGAAAAGTVIYAGPAPRGYTAYGNLVVILHRDGYKTVYAHLARVEEKYLVGVQSKSGVYLPVSQGEKIGDVGMSGRADGYHLHFEYRKGASKTKLIDGQALNPEHHVDLSGISGWRPPRRSGALTPRA